jgi:hypothetical protein
MHRRRGRRRGRGGCALRARGRDRRDGWAGTEVAVVVAGRAVALVIVAVSVPAAVVHARIAAVAGRTLRARVGVAPPVVAGLRVRRRRRQRRGSRCLCRGRSAVRVPGRGNSRQSSRRHDRDAEHDRCKTSPCHPTSSLESSFHSACPGSPTEIRGGRATERALALLVVPHGTERAIDAHRQRAKHVPNSLQLTDGKNR